MEFADDRAWEADSGAQAHSATGYNVKYLIVG